MRKKTHRNSSIRTNILIITSLGDPPYTGGIENVVDTLIKSNLKLKYNFSIFDTFRKADPNRNLRHKCLFAIQLAVRCRLAILGHQPRIAHIHFCSQNDFWKHGICLLVCKAMGINTIFHLHGGTYNSFYEQSNKIKRMLSRFILSQPNILIALSEYWYDFLSHLTDKKKIRVVPNPINCKELCTYSHAKTSVSLERSVVLLGSLGKRKGHYDVLQAIPLVLAKYPDTQFYFAGLDEEYGTTDRLKRIAKDTNIESQVHFLGAVSGDDKLKLIGKTGVLILPSYGENMPISVLEGMAANKPIVTTHVGAIPEVITDGKSGLLISPGDWKGLAEQLNLLFSFPDKALAIGHQAGKRVRKNWDVDTVISKHVAIYESLLK